MKLNYQDGQTVNDTLAILTQIQQTQQDPANQIDGLRQVPTSAIEATALRQMWEHSPIRLPIIQQLRFGVPAAAFTDQRDRDQLTITTARLGPGREKRVAMVCQISSTIT